MSAPGDPSGWIEYDQGAVAFAAQYEAVRFDDVHAAWLDLLPERPGRALDVGAGSGRDAAALAARGWTVVAAEPADALRAEATRLHPSPRIRWVAAALPGLEPIAPEGSRFELVLVSAVWMHLSVAEGPAAMAGLAGLLAPEGLLVISFKARGARSGQRDVRVDELLELARAEGLEVVRDVGPRADLERRDGVVWRTLALGCRGASP